MSNCGNCANYNTERMRHTDICGKCFVEGQNGHISGKPSKWKPKPLTNGDRICVMTDEEKADFFTLIQQDAYNIGDRMRSIDDAFYPTSRAKWIEWLKLPFGDSR